MFNNKTVILGITGGIAAYKAIDIISRLKKLGINVEVILTESAKEFITPLTAQIISGNKVHDDMFKRIIDVDVEHIELAKKADLVLIAPATANTISKVKCGIADNLLSTVIMATNANVLFAPAMNTKMYMNPIIQNNIDELKQLGYHFVGPASGKLACGDVGVGKMEEVDTIVDACCAHLYPKDLKGKKIIITAGPTVEYIDPVRYISNRSSGKMGYAIAREAVYRGAEVVLISGPVKEQVPYGLKFVPVVSTQEMFSAVDEYFDECHWLIKAAAPADFRTDTVQGQKIKKKDNEEERSIKLVENPDIVGYFGKKKKNQIIVGFAAETNDIINNAKIKIRKKNLDLIILNDVSAEGAGFDVDTNIITTIDSNGEIRSYDKLLKTEVARIIINETLKFEGKVKSEL